MQDSRMITHTAADGLSCAVHETEEEEESVRTDDTSLEEDHVWLKPFWLLIIILCTIGQIVVSTSLRNEIEQQLPTILQQQLEQLENVWPNFNESLEWLRFNQSLTKTYATHERLRPGFQLAKEKGAKGKYPLVMIPGFVTSGLEVWQGKECAKKYFRQRMWGGVGSVQHWLMERHCVMEHLALDLMTGTDPEDIRIRAAQGFEAADFFMGSYWVWSKILENLADVGYDGSTMSMESYDWRLAFPMLEERDGYFTKLKYKIEAFHSATGKKVILTSHSLGGLLVHYFFAWVSDKDKSWADEHIHAFVNIAGPHLGVSKAASALLSGEMSDTVFMGAVGNLVESFIGRKLRQELWATWGSLYAMLPKGGVWGNNIIEMTDIQEVEKEVRKEDKKRLKTEEEARIKEENARLKADLKKSKESIMNEALKDTILEAMNSFASRRTHSASQVIDFLLKWGAGQGPNTSPARLLSFDHQHKDGEKTWHDVSRTPLPHAPKMKIYCLYGVGLETEKGYFYKRAETEGFVLDTSVDDPENGIVHGVKYGNGDATVPLVSLGYMCSDAWRQKKSGLNPSGIEIVTREYKHEEEFAVDDIMRRGTSSADHVDILGNENMLLDLMKIVTDEGSVTDHIQSDILVIAKEINMKGGGLKKRKRFRNPFRNWRRKGTHT